MALYLGGLQPHLQKTTGIPKLGETANPKVSTRGLSFGVAGFNVPKKISGKYWDYH